MQKYITVVHVRFAHSISIKKSSVKRTRERKKEKRSIFTENSLQRYRFISPIVRFPWRHGSHSEAIHVRIEPKLPFPPLSIYIYTRIYTSPTLVQGRRNRHERGERRCGPNWISTKSR